MTHRVGSPAVWESITSMREGNSSLNICVVAKYTRSEQSSGIGPRTAGDKSCVDIHGFREKKVNERGACQACIIAAPWPFELMSRELEVDSPAEVPTRLKLLIVGRKTRKQVALPFPFL